MAARVHFFIVVDVGLQSGPNGLVIFPVTVR